MNHLSRLLSILTILKSKRLVTGNELAQKYQVSVRTIYRDIRKLEEAGIPVVTIEGKGYSMMDGYTMAPMMFDEKEVNALITAEELIAKTNDDSLISDFDSTLQKIKAVFRNSMKFQEEALKKKMLVFKSDSEEIRTSSLSSIQMAIINFSVIEMSYVSLKKELTERKIEPVAICCFDEKWLVIGWCRLREDYRIFRLDRIQSFSILRENFEERNFDIQEYFSQCPANAF